MKNYAVWFLVLILILSFGACSSAETNEENTSSQTQSANDINSAQNSAHTIIAQGTYGDNITWTFGEGILTISGTGDMANHDINDVLPWNDYIEDTEQVIIEDGIASVGEFIFMDNESITQLTLGDSVERIERAAFNSCDKLQTVNFSKNLTTLKERAFSDCSVLNNIVLPQNVAELDICFLNCENLKNITLKGDAPKIQVHNDMLAGLNINTTINYSGAGYEEYVQEYPIYNWQQV